MCDEVIKLLTAPYEFFEALLKYDSTEDQINEADIKKKELMSLTRKSDILKGNITVKGHLIESHSIFWMKKFKRLGLPLRKIIKQCVEQNHQIGRRLDEQTKRMQSSDLMANKYCKRKALEAHGLVEKQIMLVREGTTKNQPKRKSSVGISSSPVPARQLHAVTPTPSKRCVLVKDGGTVVPRNSGHLMSPNTQIRFAVVSGYQG